MSPALLEDTDHFEASKASLSLLESVEEIKGAPDRNLGQNIQHFHDCLTSLRSFDPCQKTDALFDELVNFIVREAHLDVEMEDLLKLEGYAKLCHESRLICAKAESALELVSRDVPLLRQRNGLKPLSKHWARRIIADHERLLSFPYHSNYLQLTSLEYHLLRGQGARPKHILFVGSGPLPLSCLAMASQHLASDWPNDDWFITNVDICSTATQLAREVCMKCMPQYSSNNSSLCCNAADIDEALIGTYDTIYLAALVGLEGEEKKRIIRHLSKSMKKDSRLLIRSAIGLRQILYPQITQQAVLEAGDGCLEVEVICHPRNKVINSVIVTRKV